LMGFLFCPKWHKKRAYPYIIGRLYLQIRGSKATP